MGNWSRGESSSVQQGHKDNSGCHFVAIYIWQNEEKTQWILQLLTKLCWHHWKYTERHMEVDWSCCLAREYKSYSYITLGRLCLEHTKRCLTYENACDMTHSCACLPCWSCNSANRVNLWASQSALCTFAKDLRHPIPKRTKPWPAPHQPWATNPTPSIKPLWKCSWFGPKRLPMQNIHISLS